MFSLALWDFSFARTPDTKKRLPTTKTHTAVLLCICHLASAEDAPPRPDQLSFEECLHEFGSGLQGAGLDCDPKSAGEGLTVNSPETVKTPEAKLVVIPQHTPPALPRPTAKMQLTAAKKLALEMKKNGLKQNDSPENPGEEKKDDNANCGANGKSKKNKKDKTDKSTEKEKKKKRKPANGPLMDTYNKFLADRKKQGVARAEALKQWRSSEERHNLISSMSEAERKRRRYDD